jgi:phosphate starvation-inducible PhoH-like protein
LDLYLAAATISPRTDGQKDYVRAILENDLTFCVGPAGTGKTYLAVAVALSLLKRGKIKRIVLARPAVEAGEKLGFLPGLRWNPYAAAVRRYAT